MPVKGQGNFLRVFGKELRQRCVMPKLPRGLTLVLGAMPSEIRLFRTEMTQKKSGQLAGLPYLTGVLRGRRVVTAVTGVGVTNGAMVAALLVHAFRPAEVIVSGTGSRLNPRLRTGDTIISTKTIHHAAGTLTDGGMVYRKVHSPIAGRMTSWYYRPAPRLLKLARAAVDSYETQPITVNGNTYLPRVLTGVVAASDLFGVSEAKIADMRKKLNPDIMEMESAAIAQVCCQFGVEHIVFRAGSNRTQPNPGGDYRKLGQTAAAAAARWTMHFIGCLATGEGAQ